MGTNQADSESPANRDDSKGASRVLVLLLAINMFNYIDRQVLSAVLPKLQLDQNIFNISDPNLQSKTGWLTSAFMFTYMLLSPVFARFGDRSGRWTVIGFAIIFWSLSSTFSGFAISYGMLLITRCMVGVGEAAYGPIAPAMLSDLYSEKRRGKIMTLFYLAIPVGSALGYVIGGQVEQLAGRWQAAFWITSLGLIPGIMCLFMREPEHIRAMHQTRKNEPTVNYLTVLKSLSKIRTFVLVCAGMTCTTFVLGGVAVFIPIYIFQREARFESNGKMIDGLLERNSEADRELVPNTLIAELKKVPTSEPLRYKEFYNHLEKGIPEEKREQLKQYSSKIFDGAATEDSMKNGEITFKFGIITVLCGLGATLLGGIVGDRLRDRGMRGAYLQASGWGTLLGFPAFVGILFAPFPWAWICVALAVFWLFFNTGPANAVLANITRPEIRATAFAINILVIHLLGDAISPGVIGNLADIWDLHTAFLIISFLILLGGVLWLIGAHTMDEDTRAATAA